MEGKNFLKETEKTTGIHNADINSERVNEFFKINNFKTIEISDIMFVNRGDKISLSFYNHNHENFTEEQISEIKEICKEYNPLIDDGIEIVYNILKKEL